MRGLEDVSKLAAAAALVFGIAAFGTLGCSGQDSSVDTAPPVEGDLEIDEIDEIDMGEMQEEEEDAQY